MLALTAIFNYCMYSNKSVQRNCKPNFCLGGGSIATYLSIAASARRSWSFQSNAQETCIYHTYYYGIYSYIHTRFIRRRQQQLLEEAVSRTGRAATYTYEVYNKRTEGRATINNRRWRSKDRSRSHVKITYFAIVTSAEKNIKNTAHRNPPGDTPLPTKLSVRFS